MDPNQQAKSTYQDYIEELLKHSEQPIVLERKISLKYLASSFKAAIKKYPTIRLPVPRQKRVLKNTKIISLIDRSPKQSKKQEQQIDEMNSSKRLWEIETKAINKPKIADLCALSPKKYIETFELNLKFLREQNETYLRAKDSQIKQKIKNKHNKVKTEPIAYQQPQMKERISRPYLKSRIASKYDHLLEERLIRKSISISRCYPLARSIEETAISDDNNLLNTNASIRRPDQNMELINPDERESIGRSVDSYRKNEDEGSRSIISKTTPKRRVQCHKIFINQLNQFKNINRINRTTISTELAVLKQKKSLSINSSESKTCQKYQMLPHFSFRNEKQSEILDPILHHSRDKDNTFIKQNLFKRLSKDRDIYCCRQRKSAIRNLIKSGEEENQQILYQDDNSCLTSFQKKRVVFSNKNICKGLNRVPNEHCVVDHEEQL